MSGSLGILDWGIGGLDLYRRLRTSGSQRDVVYWSDAGVRPYGLQSPERLTARVAAVVERLGAEGCRQVLIACNAASTVLHEPALRHHAARHGVVIAGVIAPAIAAVEREELKAVTVIGGRRTILSRAYTDPLEALGCRVTAHDTQPLSALVERGEVEGSSVDATLPELLGPVRNTEHLVLACTHYIALLPAIRRWLPRLRGVVDPAAETVTWLGRHLGSTGGSGRARFVTTGSPEATREAAARAFGLRLPAVESVELTE